MARPEKLTGQAKTDTLAMLDHTSADAAATITEHIAASSGDVG
jgi:hypothetical protein